MLITRLAPHGHDDGAILNRRGQVVEPRQNLGAPCREFVDRELVPVAFGAEHVGAAPGVSAVDDAAEFIVLIGKERVILIEQERYLLCLD